MRFANETHVPALLWRTSIDDHRIAAAVVARITYRVADGRLAMDDEQPWLVSSTPWESPAGPLLPDDCFRRGGVDLIVIGSARAPGGRPTGKIEVRVALGDFVGGVDVYGERVWARGLGGDLHATRPIPFVERPLSLELAYGGKQMWDGLEAGFPANPRGLGWYLDADAAVDRPLPNIEAPGRPIERWSDQPDPVGVGFCPPGFGPALKRSVEFDRRGNLTKLSPTFFNNAFPDMIAPPPPEGARCTAFGVLERGQLAFRIPPVPLFTHVQIGATRVDRPLQIDQIGIEPDLGRVFITYRFPFRYAVIRMQPRACALRWSPRAGDG